MHPLDQLINYISSGDENRAEEIARSFPNYGQAGLTALLNLYKDKDAEIRWWAVRTIAAFDPAEYPETSEMLIEGLQDDAVEVSACAAIGLREKPTPDAVPVLLGLLSHEDKLLARLAGDALIALQKSATAGLLEVYEQAGSAYAKIETVRALALIGDPSSISTLVDAWQHGSSMVQYWAERGLNDMGFGMAFFDPQG